MDARAAKLALARKKLKDHQDKKNLDSTQKSDVNEANKLYENDILTPEKDIISPENASTAVIVNTEISDANNYSAAVIVNTEISDSNNYSSEFKQDDATLSNKSRVDATEILIASKIKLEQHILNLEAKNREQETKLLEASDKYENLHQKVISLENELKNINLNYSITMEKLESKDALIKELSHAKAQCINEKNNLHEEFEFTKTILAAKETENNSLHSQLFNLQSILDSTQLQLQQLTSGGHDPNNKQTQESLRHENELLAQKLTTLEQQSKSQLKEYQQTNSHFEHYVKELNEQLKMVTHKNEDLHRDVQNLSNRENGLIEQISEMEIRLQNYNRAVLEERMLNKTGSICNINEHKELLNKYEECQVNLQKISENYVEIQRLYNDSTAKLEELTKAKEFEMKQNSEVSLVKLTADITSDKVAAQRATEQNKKLKNDLLGLEETVTKLTKDKLELTEKIAAEKFLNRELTIKLAEIDEKSNNFQTTLKAKDEEMIRLQATLRELENTYKELRQSPNLTTMNNNETERERQACNDEHNHCGTEIINVDGAIEHCNGSKELIPKSEAMLKLQERFLKIMEEVADLSDEKHRLEHIIMQLQNETDTICEYVALYQQQRSLLKKRDEERSAQVKTFQAECVRLQNQLDELTGILKRFSEDTELSSYFQVQSKHEDIQKVMAILSNLKTSSLLDPKKSIEFNNPYPCSCCSGQLIDV